MLAIVFRVLESRAPKAAAMVDIEGRRVRLLLIAGALPNFGTPSAFEAVPALPPKEKKRLLRDSADEPQPILARRHERARM